jgi:hypothetical protein
LSNQATPAGRPRAQGGRHNPWPAGIVDETDNCCVALRVRVTTSREDGDLDLIDDLPRVAWGPALATLRELIGYRFGGQQREILEFEVQSIGWIDPLAPLRLERITDTGEHTLFLEALILPFGEEQAAELAEIFRREPDPSVRHRQGWEYALALERRWEQAAPDGRIARRHGPARCPRGSNPHSRRGRVKTAGRDQVARLGGVNDSGRGVRASIDAHAAGARRARRTSRTNKPGSARSADQNVFPEWGEGRAMSAQNILGALDKLTGGSTGADLGRILDRCFAEMEWAEDEIKQAQERHPDAAAKLWNTFMLIQGTHELMNTELVYRAHARALLERAYAGEDCRLPTDVEIVCAYRKRASARR